MKEKMFILILVMLICGFISSNPVCAEDIKINKKISEKSYKLQELKNNLLKPEIKKKHGTVLKIESTQMSSNSAMWLGGGIGLVTGGIIGGIVGGANSSGGSGGLSGSDAGFFAGAVIGGVSGLLIGGVTGYILGK